MKNNEEKLKKLLAQRKDLVKKIKKIENDNEDVLAHAEFIESELFSLECDKDELDMDINDLKEKMKLKKKK